VGMRGGHLEVTVGMTSILLGGDIVTSINGTRMDDPQKLAPTLRALTVGEKVKLTVYREGEVREVEFVLPERPLMPSDLPEGQTYVIGPPQGNGDGLPAVPDK
jgi:C-terminal processing protease CtpA/Prc